MSNPNDNVSSANPLIANENTYLLEKKYVSIHSEDRNIERYPDSAAFEIELPQDYQNVVSARLYSWTFPANYSVFSAFARNTVLTFDVTSPYAATSGTLALGVAAGLLASDGFSLAIEEGFYTPAQMVTELTNKMNDAVTTYLVTYLAANDPAAAALFVSYERFQVVYNEVSMNVWFGNSADGFVLTNATLSDEITREGNFQCLRQNVLPEETNWGLPFFLGMTRANLDAVQGVPRFFYGDVVTDGDNGYWLPPDTALVGSDPWYAAAPLKINLMGVSYIYLDVPQFNCLDETTPFSAAAPHATGTANAAFAKVPVTSTPLAQWFDNDLTPYKYFHPPAERIRRLGFRFRYHNRQNVNFGSFPFSFMLELNLLRPHQERSFVVHDAYNASLTRKKHSHT
jgi:hypothetical protein